MLHARLAPLALPLFASLLGLSGCTQGPASATPQRSCGAQPSIDTLLTEDDLPAPLIVELPAPQLNPVYRALDGGEIVVVRYDGCEIEVLRGCAMPGRYAWQYEVPTDFTLALPTLDSVDAEAPLGAGSLRPLLEELGPLRLDMSSNGRYLAKFTDLIPRGSDCERATHAIRQVMIGAWTVTSAGSVRVDVDAEVHGGTVSGSSVTHHDFARSEGALEACHGSRDAAWSGPVEGCRSPLQLELVGL